MAEVTLIAEDKLYTAAELKEFQKCAPEMIFDIIKNNMPVVPFSDYLKRYLSVKSNLKGDYKSIDNSVYEELIKQSFKETNTPPSFDPDSKTKISAAAKNWLRQRVISRKSVFLLGFGLKMSEDDVSQLLIKGLHEGGIYFKSAFEVLCWYCYKNGYDYARWCQLKDAYDKALDKMIPAAVSGHTFDARVAFRGVGNDNDLISLIKKYGLLAFDKIPAYSTAFNEFNKLYDKCREIIAGYRNIDEELDSGSKQYLSGASFGSSNKKGKYLSVFNKSNVNASDVESFLCSGTPVDNNGNLVKVTSSSLSESFDKKRMSRQHIHEIQQHKVPVDRFDIITLKFFVLSEEMLDKKPNARWWAFVEETNKLLNECSLGELYIANPYDCFIQLCLLSDDPLSTYDYVIERSYSDIDID